ncbi:MAG: response regulator [Anaeromyxobacteraceae bacterium]
MDDNRDLLDSLKEILEEGGSTVEIAPCAEEADRILRSGFVPSVFLLDLRLGAGESGEAFANRLRGDPRFSATPIIVASGDADALAHVGMVDRKLAKPFGIDTLFRTISEVCAAA